MRLREHQYPPNKQDQPRRNRHGSEAAKGSTGDPVRRRGLLKLIHPAVSAPLPGETGDEPSKDQIRDDCKNGRDKDRSAGVHRAQND